MSDLDDWGLVTRVRDGDTEAFAELVQRYHTPLIHFCQRMVGSQQDAEDLAQETFVKLHRYIGRLEPQAKFSTVLFGMARNLTLNHIRDAKRRGLDTAQPIGDRPLQGATSGEPDAQARVGEMRELLELALAKLSAEHREVLVLREMQGLDYDTIAAIVKCRKGTVKSRLARAREQLRLQLLELGGDMA